MQQTSAKRVQNNRQLGGRGYLLGIEQEIELWSYEQMVYAQTRIRPRKWDTKFSGILR